MKLLYITLFAAQFAYCEDIIDKYFDNLLENTKEVINHYDYLINSSMKQVDIESKMVKGYQEMIDRQLDFPSMSLDIQAKRNVWIENSKRIIESRDHLIMDLMRNASEYVKNKQDRIDSQLDYASNMLYMQANRNLCVENNTLLLESLYKRSIESTKSYIEALLFHKEALLRTPSFRYLNLFIALFF
jgi:hypothetical protein